MGSPTQSEPEVLIVWGYRKEATACRRYAIMVSLCATFAIGSLICLDCGAYHPLSNQRYIVGERRYPASLALHFDVSDVPADRSMLERQ